MMSRNTIFIAVIVVFLCGGALYWWQLSGQDEQERVYQEGEVRTATLREEGGYYLIDMKYPQFGIQKIDEHIAFGIKMLADDFKKEALAAGEPPGEFGYELISVFDAVYVSDDIISSRLAMSSYLGGAHPATTLYGLNFDKKTGEEITLDNVLKLLDVTLTQVADAADTELTSQLGESYFKEGAEPLPENYQTFSISKEAVTFIFDEYQVAPYAAGPQGVSFARE